VINFAEKLSKVLVFASCADTAVTDNTKSNRLIIFLRHMAAVGLNKYMLFLSK